MRFIIFTSLILALGCGDSDSEREIVKPVEIPQLAATNTRAQVPAAHVRAKVVRRHAHDSGAFTQGLLFHAGEIYESTGLERKSSLRRYKLGARRTAKLVHLDDQYFAEGLALAGDELVQLTWRSNLALRYERSTLKEIGRFSYQGEGWGLCFNGRELVMSDGTDTLTFRKRDDFSVTRRLPVTLDGAPVNHLNELECVEGDIYANVWQSDTIVRIDSATGNVSAVIDASDLLTTTEREKADVLNGIAYLPNSRHFLITGKLWPWIFEVEFAN